jgi:hypothetical protein
MLSAGRIATNLAIVVPFPNWSVSMIPSIDAGSRHRKPFNHEGHKGLPRKSSHNLGKE